MVDKNTNNEDEQEKTELETEEKAAEIGKKVEDATGEKEEIPDYEVTEEGSNDEDDRLSKEKPETKSQREHKELSNREKRQLKKKRIAEKFDKKDAIIRQQQEQLNAMASRLNEVDGRLSSYDQAQFTQVWNSSVEAFHAAEQKYKASFSNGDGEGASVAMREMYAAQRRIDDLEAIKARQAAQPQPKQQTAQHDPRVVNKAKEWAARNEWFKAGGGDDDSAIADAIALKLVKEGYDPRTDDYYDELDERLAKKGIGQPDEDDSDDEPIQRKPAQRKSPPVGGGGGGRGDMGGGKVAVTLPTAYINALKENGKWDDPVVRNRMIKRYQDGLKERGNG